MTPSLVRMRRLTYAAIMCLTAALAQREQPESPIDAALQDLTSPDLGTRDRGLSALLAQSGIKVGSASRMRVWMNSLLRTHPQQAEHIKTTLIAAAERVGTEYQAAARDGLVHEDFAEYQMALVDAVNALRDPRAVKALLSAGLGAGGAEGLADICPAAVDGIIQRIQKPDVVDARGNVLRYRQFALSALKACLMRPAMMRANPAVLAKIRRELLADLDDPDCTIRSSAMEAVSSLKADPEIRTRLQIMANQPEVQRCYLGYFASRILSSDEYSFFVTRTPGTGVCRLQPESQARAEEQILGPDLLAVLKPWMCSHYDPTGQDQSLCWKVEPANACSW